MASVHQLSTKSGLFLLKGKRLLGSRLRIMGSVTSLEDRRKLHSRQMTLESRRGSGPTAAAPHGSRHYDCVWFTVEGWSKTACHSFTERDDPHVNTMITALRKNHQKGHTESAPWQKARHTHTRIHTVVALQCDNWNAKAQNDALDFFCSASLQTTQMLSIWEPADTRRQLRRNTQGH